MQPLANLLQQQVALVVSLGVVQVLEIVQVNEAHRGPMLATRAGRLGLLQPVMKQPAVAQAREGVVKRQPFNLGIGTLALGHVACQAQDAECLAALVQYRTFDHLESECVCRIP